MKGNKNIKCTVESCKYNVNIENLCGLSQIQVAPVPNCNTQATDESMCTSYEN